jgi:hypothetical protein
MVTVHRSRRVGRRATIVSVVVGMLALGSGITTEQANAAVENRALVLAGTVTGGASSVEALAAAGKGLAIDVVSAATWSAMTQAQFASYRLIILGDPTCADGITPDIAAATGNARVWGPTINGNIVINGTDPVYHAGRGGATLTIRSVEFALAQTDRTGAYISLSCYFHGTAGSTPVPLLDGVGAGGFSVTGVGCYNNAHIVALSPALLGLTDAILSNWNCSVHEAFQSWPGGLIPLAIAKDFSGSFTASDGTQGPPYILAGGNIRSFPLSIDPLVATVAPGAAHSVTATLLDGQTALPVPNALIRIKVTSGPNVGVVGACSNTTCRTDANGRVTWTYTGGAGVGTDVVTAFYDLNGNSVSDLGEPLTTSGVVWVRPTTGNEVLDARVVRLANATNNARRYRVSLTLRNASNGSTYTFRSPSNHTPPDWTSKSVVAASGLAVLPPYEVTDPRGVFKAEVRLGSTVVATAEVK